jgi:hypothetical protein
MRGFLDHTNGTFWKWPAGASRTAKIPQTVTDLATTPGNGTADAYLVINNYWITARG